MASLTGQQASLGYNDNGIVKLQTKTLRNDGALKLRSRVIGNVSKERLDANGGGDLPPELPELMEGQNDSYSRRVAPRRRTTNGIHRCNTHLDFSANTNDPSSRFARIRSGYESPDALMNAITQSINAPVPISRPPHHFSDLVRDYIQASKGVKNATSNTMVFSLE